MTSKWKDLAGNTNTSAESFESRARIESLRDALDGVASELPRVLSPIASLIERVPPARKADLQIALELVNSVATAFKAIETPVQTNTIEASEQTNSHDVSPTHRM